MNRLVFIPIISAVLLSGCVNRDAQAQAKKTQTVLADQVVPVRVETTIAKPFATLLEITGSLTSNDDSEVGARVGGRLVAVLVKDGDSVVAGQVLARQDTREALTRVRQAQAQLSSALAGLREAQTAAMVAPQRSTATVRAARAQLATAEANLLKARNGARSEEKRQAEAQLRAAKTNLEIARKDMDRGQKLLDEGAISERAFDQYRQTYANALAQYESALEANSLVQAGSRSEDIKALESQVSAAREQLQSALASQRLDPQYRDRVSGALAQVDSARDAVALAMQQVTDATIRAPFSGKVAGKPLQIGTFAGPGTTVVHLVGSQGIYFEGEVPEMRISKVTAGLQMSIQLDALQGRLFSGTVAAVSPQAESLGRLYKVRITMNGNPPDIKSGMFARAKIETDTIPDAITVPSSAVLGDEGAKYVYVVQDGKAMKRSVTVGLTQAGRALVLQGLSEGDKVVVQGQTLLASGTTVRIEDSGK
ncbi:MAG: efflux RND transporter periplasmic adaptor subunit [Fimbriimonadaceae bacterium]|nr:efflux RND transporter periplasmic adaptor subunit [Fimbriimonadaceae bacterium]